MTSRDPVVLGGELTMYAARLVRAIRARGAAPAGVGVLSVLDQRGPSTVTVLAAEYGCSQPTMSGLVADLISRGWVAKHPDPADARASLVRFTEAGRAVLADVRRQHGELIVGRLRRRRAAHPDRTVADLATAVAVLRDVLDEPPKEDS